MPARPRKAANDDANVAEAGIPETWVATLADPAFRSDLEHVIEGLIELLDEVDGDADGELTADDIEDEAME